MNRIILFAAIVTIMAVNVVSADNDTKVATRSVDLSESSSTVNFTFDRSGGRSSGDTGWGIWFYGTSLSGTVTVTAQPLSQRGTTPDNTDYDTTLLSSYSLTGSDELIEALGSWPRCSGVSLTVTSASGSGTMYVELYYGGKE